MIAATMTEGTTQRGNASFVSYDDTPKILPVVDAISFNTYPLDNQANALRNIAHIRIFV
jgi:hypothetical protein